MKLKSLLDLPLVSNPSGNLSQLTRLFGIPDDISVTVVDVETEDDDGVICCSYEVLAVVE